ncbi:MAG: hypothetical protein HQM09_15365 [Candidatus Riflebacteria bacterium]|nr:hypothetical protein [Candidatus Riflebacteria bacterium]
MNTKTISRLIMCVTIFVVTLAGANFCQAVEAPTDLASALKLILEFPSKIENLDDLMSVFSEIQINQVLTGAPLNTITAANNPLLHPNPIVSDKTPKFSDAAIFDFRRTAAQDFIKYSGSADGCMTRSQFQTLVAAGRLPIKGDADEYFQSHDRDGDGKLSIWEFVPTPSEVATKQDLTLITSAYMSGTPYPTGNYPTARPMEAPPGPLPGSGTNQIPPASSPPPLPPPPPVFLSVAEIEKRLTDFANQNGYTTTRGLDGRLVIIDQNGVALVSIPPGVLPISLPNAVPQLTAFAQSFGGTTEKGPDLVPIIKDKNGQIVPIAKWPPNLQPPYMPPGPPPPAGPPGPPPPPPPGN